jgi:hypothetical protein
LANGSGQFAKAFKDEVEHGHRLVCVCVFNSHDEIMKWPHRGDTYKLGSIEVVCGALSFFKAKPCNLRGHPDSLWFLVSVDMEGVF